MRVRLSRAINYYLFRGKKGQMISTRVYVEHRQAIQFKIDWLFFIFRGEMNHCRNSMLWDYRDEKAVSKTSDERATGTQEEEARHE